MAQKTKTEAKRFVVAKTDDGTVQVTFLIPFAIIKKERDAAVEAIAKDIEIPGFRRGKAPIEKATPHIPQNTLLEKTLSKILPKYFADAIDEEKLRPAIYPKFEIVKNEEDKDWEIRAVTCEIQDIGLGDYKEKVSGALRANSIWKPGDDKKAEIKKTKEQKESEVIKTLLETIKVTVPKILIDEEVNARLSKLLERLEKMSLSLESYLASIGKNIDQIRLDYERQAREAISLDLILNKIAEKEGVKVDEKEVQKVLNLSQVDKNLAEDLNSPEKTRLIEMILRKRSTLDLLSSLA